MKKTAKSLVTLLIACLMLISLFACGDKPGGSSSAPGSAGSPSTTPAQSGKDTDPSSGEPVLDTLNVALDSDGGTLDPASITGSLLGAIPSIMEPLWDVTLDNEVIYVLAESVEQVSDTQYTVHLRKGVKFSNGSDFTADDVIFSIKRHKEFTATGGPRVQTLDIEATKAIDEYTIDMRLLSPHIAHYSVLAMMYIYDKESFDEATVTSKPIGTGPYKLVEYTPNSVTKVERRDDYWGELPEIKYINFRVLSETSQRVNALETGLVDIANVAIDDIDHVKSLPGYNLQEYYSANYSNMGFNFGSKSIFYHNLDARRAVCHAINRQAILDAVYFGNGYVMQAVVPPYCHDYEDRFNDIDETYSRGYDPDYAKQLAESSGIAGKTLRLITAGTADAIKTAEMIQNMLQAIGVNVEINNYDPATVNQMQYSEDAEYDFQVGSAFLPNRKVGDPLVNGVRFSSKLNTPGAFDDNETYLQVAPLSLSTLDPKEHSDAVYDVLYRYEHNVITYGLCDYKRYTAISDKLDLDSALRSLGTTNAAIRFRDLKIAK